MQNTIPTVKLNYTFSNGAEFKGEFTPDPIRHPWWKKLAEMDGNLTANIYQALEFGIMESHRIIGKEKRDKDGKGRLEIIEGSSKSRNAILPSSGGLCLVADLKAAVQNGMDHNQTLMKLLQLGAVLPNLQQLSENKMIDQIIVIRQQAIGNTA